jgi:UDP-N-acetylglucosamine 2-epimerase
MVRKICVVTGSRADYGLLRLIMTGIKNDPQLVLQVITTGMHLSPTFGLTYTEIEADGFSIDFKIETLTSSDSPVGIAESISQGVSGCASAFEQLKPDIILLLGDRYEIFAAATAAGLAEYDTYRAGSAAASEAATVVDAAAKLNPDATWEAVNEMLRAL